MSIRKTIAALQERHGLADELAKSINDICDEIASNAYDEGREEGYKEGESENAPDYKAVGEDTLVDLKLGLSLIKSDPQAADVYLTRVLRDFEENGFHGGKLL
jgi:hypothetical protein